jgi:hypothetical protein
MPPYRMQALLEIRGRAKEAAEQAFADAQRAVVAARQKQKELEEDLVRRRAERKARVDAYLKEILARGTGAGGLVQMNRFEQRLKDEEAALQLEIDAQKERVRQAEQFAEQKRAEMAEAAKELKAIEKHKEAWAKQVKEERDKREELVQEEIGSALHLARQRKD